MIKIRPKEKKKQRKKQINYVEMRSLGVEKTEEKKVILGNIN